MCDKHDLTTDWSIILLVIWLLSWATVERGLNFSSSACERIPHHVGHFWQWNFTSESAEMGRVVEEAIQPKRIYKMGKKVYNYYQEYRYALMHLIFPGVWSVYPFGPRSFDNVIRCRTALIFTQIMCVSKYWHTAACIWVRILNDVQWVQTWGKIKISKVLRVTYLA